MGGTRGGGREATKDSRKWDEAPSSTYRRSLALYLGRGKNGLFPYLSLFVCVCMNVSFLLLYSCLLLSFPLFCHSSATAKDVLGAVNAEGILVGKKTTEPKVGLWDAV